MSMYVSFFVRKDNDFLPLGDFSANSAIGGLFFNSAPLGKLISLTYDGIDVKREEIKNDRDYYELRLTKNQTEIDAVAQFNNTAEEKYELLHQLYSTRYDLKEEYDECEFLLNYCTFLESILDSTEELDEDNYIYYGLEIGTPTVDMIEKRG